MPVQLLLSMLRNPASTGALFPSSRGLARAMADAASGAERVVELGAGTGPVTHALIEALPYVPLTAVEIEPALAATLRQRFPDVDVQLAPASQVIDALASSTERIVLVSSLPFRSLPQPARISTVMSLCNFLSHHPERRLVQFTYQPRAPFSVPAGLRWAHVATVWANTPPAGIWELQACA